MIAGTMIALTPEGSTIVPVGEYISPNLGEQHGVATNETGCAYVGVCHKDHMTDVHYKEDASLVEPSKRVTLIVLHNLVPVNGVPESFSSFQTDTCKTGAPFRGDTGESGALRRSDKTIEEHLRDAFVKSTQVN